MVVKTEEETDRLLTLSRLSWNKQERVRLDNYVLREREGGVKRDTQVTDTRRVCVGREFLSQ